jgi:Domain of unknown function (DUF4189)
MGHGAGIGAAVLAAVLLKSGLGLAAGAAAIAIPPDEAKQGLAMGFSWNAATEDEARSVALAQCKKHAGSSALLLDLCKVAKTFRNQCVADALDPQVGMAGYGWAIADTLQAAKDQALANCKSTADPGRAGACRLGTAACDGSAR